MGMPPKTVPIQAKPVQTKDEEKEALRQKRLEEMGLGGTRKSTAKATPAPVASQIGPNTTASIPTASVGSENIHMKTICTKIIRANVNIEEKMQPNITLVEGKPRISKLKLKMAIKKCIELNTKDMEAFDRWIECQA